MHCWCSREWPAEGAKAIQSTELCCAVQRVSESPQSRLESSQVILPSIHFARFYNRGPQTNQKDMWLMSHHVLCNRKKHFMWPGKHALLCRAWCVSKRLASESLAYLCRLVLTILWNVQKKRTVPCGVLRPSSWCQPGRVATLKEQVPKSSPWQPCWC